MRISRQDLLKVVNTTPGFVSFSMSEPLKTYEFERYAWVSYSSEEACREAKSILESTTIKNFRLNPIRSQTQRKPIRITPPLSSDCIERDLDLCKRLILEVFDPEKQITSFDKIQEVAKFLRSEQQLDLYLLYLRRVHAYCFYCGEEYDDERMLAAKCGPQHLRSQKRIPRHEFETSVWSGSKQFEEKYVRCAQDRLIPGPKMLEDPAEDKVLMHMK